MMLSGKYRSGFTLVEIMVSMVIGSVVLLTAMAVLRTTGDGYERVGGGVVAEREARALLGQLQTDLGSARFHEDTLLETGSEQWPLDRIGFLTLQPDDAQLEENRLGDLCAVRYYVKDQTVGGKTIRCLMRGFVESNETFTKLREKDVKSLFTEPPSSSANVDEAIAFGVVSFEVRPKTREENGKLVDWKPDLKTAPEMLSLRLIVARRELVPKLTDAAAWSGKGPLASLMGAPADAERNKNFQVYETTVRFGHHEDK
jgi:prepilin-type N-terminal cleavage/methylation domain-containing protein